MLADSAVEGVSSSSSTKDVGSSSPLTDRKKHRRKKSLNQKGDAASGQADGKHGLYLVFGTIPANIPQIFNEICYISFSPHSQTQNVEN